MGRSSKVADALSCHPLNSDSPSECDTNTDEVNVISYPLKYDDTEDDPVEMPSYLSVCEIFSWHLDTTKIPNGLKVEAQTISCVAEPLIKEEDNLEIVAKSSTT